ncbi:endonuclease [Candidatus Parcubacteria bacterium]|nr:MAG: endonuclease [Candidatus Parcubacteria bacterium]
MWYVYILECSDKTYYTGIAKDPEKRLNEHNQEKSGAKYTRARRPVKMVYKAKYKNRSMAQKEEIRIKKLARKEKKLLII